jgi:hypothetical protein
MGEISGAEKLIRIFSIIIAIVFIIVLILIKVYNPKFPFGYFILGICGVVVFFVIIIVGYHFLTKDKNTVIPGTVSDKLPPPATVEQCRELAKAQMKNPVYADYPDGVNKETNELLGKTVKSYVYSFTTVSVYSKQKFVIIMNRHFPNETLNVLIDPTDYEISKIKNNVAFTPMEEPNVKEVTISDPLTGREMKTREEIHSQDKEDDKSKKEDI